MPEQERWYTAEPGYFLSQKDMEHNAGIWAPIMHDAGFVDNAIVAVLSWADYFYTMNPHAQDQEPLGLATKVGLLGWTAIDILGQYPGETWKDGYNQTKFFQYTVDNEANFWKSNENASPVEPPITLKEWVGYGGKDMETFSWLTFGWYYMQNAMDYFTRREIEIRSDFWKVWVSEQDWSGGGDKKKKRKWIYYLKPYWRR